MVTVAGVLIGIALARLAGAREPRLRTAILSQAADLVSFTVVWEFGLGERNPLALLVLEAARAAFGTATTTAEYAATIVLVGLKLGLVGYLVAVEQVLGRYRRPVLAVAAGAGLIGAASNVIAYGNAAASLLIVAPFAIVAARRPERFRDALGTGIRLLAVVALGFGGLMAISYVEAMREGYLCDPTACPPILVPGLQALAVACMGAALVGLWLTLRFSRRLFVPRAAHAEVRV